MNARHCLAPKAIRTSYRGRILVASRLESQECEASFLDSGSHLEGREQENVDHCIPLVAVQVALDIDIVRPDPRRAPTAHVVEAAEAEAGLELALTKLMAWAAERVGC